MFFYKMKEKIVSAMSEELAYKITHTHTLKSENYMAKD